MSCQRIFLSIKYLSTGILQIVDLLDYFLNIHFYHLHRILYSLVNFIPLPVSLSCQLRRYTVNIVDGLLKLLCEVWLPVLHFLSDLLLALINDVLDVSDWNTAVWLPNSINT